MSVCTIVSTDYKNLNVSVNESEMDIIALKKNLLEVIWQCFRNGATEFYVNCEYGIPFWSAEIIVAMKLYNDIQLHIVSPHENQSLDWHEEFRNRYYMVHENADSVELASIYDNEDCYREADEMMCDESDFVLIFGDKSEKFHVADYAKENGIEVRYIGIGELLE